MYSKVVLCKSAVDNIGDFFDQGTRRTFEKPQIIE